MPGNDEGELKEKLDQFGELLGQRIKEFNRKGRLSDQRRAFLNNIRRSNDALPEKVENAAISHRPGEYTKAKLWRDFGTVMNELVALDELVDADTMKKA